MSLFKKPGASLLVVGLLLVFLVGPIAGSLPLVGGILGTISWVVGALGIAMPRAPTTHEIVPRMPPTSGSDPAIGPTRKTNNSPTTSNEAPGFLNNDISPPFRDVLRQYQYRVFVVLP